MRVLPGLIQQQTVFEALGYTGGPISFGISTNAVGVQEFGITGGTGTPPSWQVTENGNVIVDAPNAWSTGNFSWTPGAFPRIVSLIPPNDDPTAFGGEIYWGSRGIAGTFPLGFGVLTGITYVFLNGDQYWSGELGNLKFMTGLTTLEASLGVGAGTYGFQRADLFEAGPVLNYVDLNGHRLDAAGVNNIIHQLDIAGTVSGYLDLSGGLSAAPDTTSGGVNGVAAKANLQGKGWTVATN